MAGYIKIYRKLREWGWYGVPSVKDTFLHLLITAAFAPYEYKGVRIERGAAIFSLDKLSAELGFSVQQIRTAIQRLKKTGEITVWTNWQFSVATIVNYDDYQEEQIDNKRITNAQQTDNKRLTNEQQTDNNIKEDKEDREDKKGREISDYAAVVEAFNSICVSLPKVIKLTEARRRAIRNAVQQHTDFDTLFRMVEASDFLTNRSGKFSGCGFDWILKPANMVKILEGNYKNKADKSKGSVFSAEGASFDLAQYEGRSLFND